MIVKFSFCVTRNENRNLYSFNLLLKTGNFAFNLLAYLSLFEADCNLFLFELKIIYYLTF